MDNPKSLKKSKSKIWPKNGKKTLVHPQPLGVKFFIKKFLKL